MKCLCVFPLVLLIFCGVTSALAQSTDATISGVVVDPAGKVIPDAKIEIVNDATGVHFSSETNGAGIYTVTILPPGQYRLQVSKAGFKTLIKPGIILNVQSAVALNFTLPVGATSESVTVEAGSSMLNTSDASVSTVIDHKFVENLPLNGRSFQDLISMTPGVVTESPQSGSSVAYNGDFSVNGQRTESNYYTIDGVSANFSGGSGAGGDGPAQSGSLPATSALGTTQSLISVDGLQELRVTSSTYSAEFGRNPGGQFSLATKSGTKSFHGTAFDYLRNNYFDANNWFNDYFGAAEPALRQNDFGGTVGGPLGIPKVFKIPETFFFVSYEGLRLIQPQAASAEFVPDLSMRQTAAAALQPILNAFPLPNGTDFGTPGSPSLAEFLAPYSLPSQIDSLSLRFDHVVSSKMTAFFRFGYTPSSTASRSLSVLTTYPANATSYTLGLTNEMSNRLTNELRIGFSKGDSAWQSSFDNFGGAVPINLSSYLAAGSYPSPDLIFELPFAGVGTSTLLQETANNKLTQWNIVDTVSWIVGAHQFKFGVDYRRIASMNTSASPFIATVFENDSQLQQNLTPELYISYRLFDEPLTRNVSAFAQDEWRLSRRLVGSFGLRWEVDPPPTAANGQDAFTLKGDINNPLSLTVAPRGTALWNTSWFSFAPRLGLAWTVNRHPGRETVVRTGGGVFFDTDDEAATLAFSGLGFSAANVYSGVALPATQSMMNFAPSVQPPYTSAQVYAFPSHLQLPYTLQWNVSVQQALGTSQAFTLSYVGSNGRRLLTLLPYNLGSLNPIFGTIYYSPNNVTSNYQALQAQFQRSVTHGLQVLASYTWSHAIDYGSSAYEIPQTRGNSDFDVRHNVVTGFSYDLPFANRRSVLNSLVQGWGVDGRWMAHTSFPITLAGNESFDSATGAEFYNGVNLVPDEPIYLHGSENPGGKALNPAAFVAPSDPTATGDAPRNFARGFGATQVNLAIRRQVHLYDNLVLQFRAETFNLLNHPTFGYVDPYLTDVTFGQATQTLNQSLGTMAPQYQQGGPRSMQFALKLVF